MKTKHEKPNSVFNTFRFLTSLIFIAAVVNTYFFENSSKEPLQFEADQASKKEVMNEIASTPQGQSQEERIGGKDVALTQFQDANGISEKLVEVTIKE